MKNFHGLRVILSISSAVWSPSVKASTGITVRYQTSFAPIGTLSTTCLASLTVPIKILQMKAFLNVAYDASCRDVVEDLEAIDKT